VPVPSEHFKNREGSSDILDAPVHMSTYLLSSLYLFFHDFIYFLSNDRLSTTLNFVGPKGQCHGILYFLY
jgi:hypothetical protein